MTLYNYRIGDQVNVTSGTGTLASSGTAITGTTTNFDGELVEGSIIHAAGQRLVVASVTDDTHCAVVTAPTVALSGDAFTITAMTNLETLGLNAPRSTFKPWQSVAELGNGLRRGLGRPSATWRWDWMTQANRNSLRAYCTGKSARVYIHTRKNDTSEAYADYDAVMIWPDEEEKQAGQRLNFTLEFRDLIAL